jgi:ribose 5-phosphate isomerase B
MTIAFGNDHAGYRLRAEVLATLRNLGVEVLDHGSDSPEPVDFPVISRKVCRTVLGGKADRGILLCGTGIGAAMASNKYKGVRAGVCHDTYSAHQGVEHDDMNILCIGAQIVGPWLIKDIVKAFLEAKFDGTEDVARRCGMMNELGSDLDPAAP